MDPFAFVREPAQDTLEARKAYVRQQRIAESQAKAYARSQRLAYKRATGYYDARRNNAVAYRQHANAVLGMTSPYTNYYRGYYRNGHYGSRCGY